MNEYEIYTPTEDQVLEAKRLKELEYQEYLEYEQLYINQNK